MSSDIREKANDELLVLLNEEYGYRRWFWFPEMTASELMAWWECLESVSPYFMTPEPLPGNVIKVDHETSDIWEALDREEVHYSAHLHCDDDSILITPEGGRIYHRGYEE